MKPLIQLVLTTTAILTLVNPAHAQIVWGSLHSITGSSSDISNAGTSFDAINTIWNSSYTTTTVGDTTFNALTLDSVSGRLTSDGTISDVITSGDGNFHGVGAPHLTDTTANDAYGYAINNASDGVGTVTIGSVAHPLTIGDIYQVQVWGYWHNTSYGAQLNGRNSVSFPNGGGGYFLGIFKADATTENFTYQGNSDSYGAGFVNDIAVREVPEPSTYAMMAAGLGILAFVGRLRRKA